MSNEKVLRKIRKKLVLAISKTLTFWGLAVSKESLDNPTRTAHRKWTNSL